MVMFSTNEANHWEMSSYPFGILQNELNKETIRIHFQKVCCCDGPVSVAVEHEIREIFAKIGIMHENVFFLSWKCLGLILE